MFINILNQIWRLRSLHWKEKSLRMLTWDNLWDSQTPKDGHKFLVLLNWAHRSMDQHTTHKIDHTILLRNWRMKHCKNGLQLWMLSLLKSNYRVNCNEVQWLNSLMQFEFMWGFRHNWPNWTRKDYNPNRHYKSIDWSVSCWALYQERL